MTKTFSRTLMGLGLASSLFLGCQQFLGQEDAAKPGHTSDATGSDGAPSDVALQLSVKETAECKALRDQVIAADAAGEATVTLQTEFIKKCIEEVKSSDAAKNVIVAAGLPVDDKTRCRWIVSQIEGGRQELVIKLHYYCPAECDTLRTLDSVRHVRVCRDPAPDCAGLKAKLAVMDPKSEEYARLRLFLSEHCGPRDTIIRPPKDTVVRPQDCDSLRRLLATLDTSSTDYDRVARIVYGKCPVKPPIDTIIRPVPTSCDSLRRLLAHTDPSTEAYAKLKALYYQRCVDTIVKPRPKCDSLRKVLASMDTNSVEYDRMLAYVQSLCGIVVPRPPSLCDSLRKQLAMTDPSTEAYAKLKALYHQRCVDTLVKPRPNCDSLRKVLARMDTNSVEYDRMLAYVQSLCGIVPPPPILTICDSLRRQLAMTRDTAVLARLKRLIAETCGDVKPVDPPDSTYCEHLLAKLKGLDPASPEYATLKREWSAKCAEVGPVDPIKPVDPADPARECLAILEKMKGLEPHSADWNYLNGLLAKQCNMIID